jgi:hypothetical protein
MGDKLSSDTNTRAHMQMMNDRNALPPQPPNKRQNSVTPRTTSGKTRRFFKWSEADSETDYLMYVFSQASRPGGRAYLSWLILRNDNPSEGLLGQLIERTPDVFANPANREAVRAACDFDGDDMQYSVCLYVVILSMLYLDTYASHVLAHSPRDRAPQIIQYCKRAIQTHLLGRRHDDSLVGTPTGKGRAFETVEDLVIRIIFQYSQYWDPLGAFARHAGTHHTTDCHITLVDWKDVKTRQRDLEEQMGDYLP